MLILLNILNGWHVSPAEDITVEYGSGQEIPAPHLQGKLFFKNGFALKANGTVNREQLGSYELTYKKPFSKKQLSQTVTIVDTTAPIITLNTVDGYYTLPGTEYAEEGFTATDNYDGDITASVTAERQGDKIIYSVCDSSGNETIVERAIVYTDPVAPELTLKGQTEVTLEIGSEYTEEGFTAVDNCDGNITGSVKVTKEDTGWIYTVTDTYGNETVQVRKFTYVDTTAPSITLNGNSPVTVYLGEEYIEEGCTAVDLADGDVSAQVSVSSDVDPKTPGTYSVTYTVTDAAGNTASAERVVYVNALNIKKLEEEGKVIYLTFDDGPCGYTEKLLDVLDKYNVKVTFFVTKAHSRAAELIKEIYDRGHSIGIHTMSHEYSKIYQSVDAYLEDLYGMQQFIYEATGYTTTLMRFPGGSSNKISANYCKGIMSELVQIVREKGFQYFDWNVSSEDASGRKGMTSADVASFVKRGVNGKKVSVVLQHDIKAFSVDAVEDIIIWGLENGYTFLPLTMDSFPAHHGVNN